MFRDKKIILSLFSLLFLLLSAISYAESLTDWERGVFMEIVERWHEILYQHPGDYVTGEEKESIYAEVANKYNITAEQVKDIDTKGLEWEPFGESDVKIVEDLDDRISNRPKGYDSRSIHIEIANKYGISLSMLHEIEYIMMEVGWMGYSPPP